MPQEVEGVELVGNSIGLLTPILLFHCRLHLLKLLLNAIKATTARYGWECKQFPRVNCKLRISNGPDRSKYLIEATASRLQTPTRYGATCLQLRILQLLGLNRTWNQVGWDHKWTDPAVAGLGYVLPLARGFARFLGGDVEISSKEGHGTDAILCLSRADNSTKILKI